MSEVKEVNLDKKASTPQQSARSITTKGAKELTEEERLRKIAEETVNFMMELEHGESHPEVTHDHHSHPHTGKIPAKTVSRKRDEDYCKIGDVLEGKWLITSKLKVGGFAQIFKAKNKFTNQEVAVKVERMIISSPTDNIEIAILKRLQGHSNCPKLYAVGLMPQFSYIVMELLGKNLTDLRRMCPLVPPRLSMSVVYRLMVQCITGIEGLHNIGHIHRDIKPSNFAVGRETIGGTPTVYLFDFGLCKCYVESDGKVKPSRGDNVGFRGTVRYASLTAHELKDLSRKDDVISLYYSFLELLTGHLPWRKTNEKAAVEKLKREYSLEVLSKAFPSEINEIVVHIQKLNFFDKPNYEFLRNCIKNVWPKIGVKVSDPYDWLVIHCKTLVHWSPQKKAS